MLCMTENKTFSYSNVSNMVLCLYKKEKRSNTVTINHHGIAMMTAVIGKRSECGESFSIQQSRVFLGKFLTSISLPPPPPGEILI